VYAVDLTDVEGRGLVARLYCCVDEALVVEAVPVGWGGGDNGSLLLDVHVPGTMLVDMRIILIPLALVAAVVIAMVLLGARARPPTPVGPALAMNASYS
jgi:hypothetical protein